MTFTNFIKRPVLSTVISIFFVLLGIIGLISLPIEQYPDIAPPTISIQTSYQGADAQTVLNSVITPLEESINGVENMTYMESTATNAGMAMITVYFKQGSDPNMAAVNVQNRVSQAQALLPAEVTRVGVTVSKRQSSNVIMYSLTTDDGRYDDEFLTNYNNINIVPMLKRINGVGDVRTPGMKTYSMRIWLYPDKMKQHKLVPSDVSMALAEQNIEAAPGSFGEQSNLKYEYTMRYKGRLKTPEEYGNIIISSNVNGQTLHLRDVAKVELGGLQYSVAMRNNGKPAVLGMVNQVAGSNATQIAEDVKTALANAEKQMPPGMKVTIEQDVTEFLFASIEEVVRTLIITLVLVFFVVYVFLQDFRSTIIPMIAVPVALIGTFFFLWVFGFSINLLTLSALLLAIAIVVDDAIVVVEAVHAKLDLGYKSALTAAIDAMNEISGAIISITLVMSAVFVPVSFIGGTSGTFYREFGVTMAVSIVIGILLLVYAVVYFESAQRKVPVHYAKRQFGSGMMPGQSIHMPFKLNMAGVIPPIFASSIILFPSTLLGWFGSNSTNSILHKVAAMLQHGQPLYIVLFATTIIFFCYFYTALVFSPKEMAENLKKSGAFVPGIRPGEQTSRYLEKVVLRLTLFGALYITTICLIPEFLTTALNVPFYLGGTSLLILVVVTMDFRTQINSYVMSSQYEDLMSRPDMKSLSRK